jgi:hypothetical protein
MARRRRRICAEALLTEAAPERSLEEGQTLTHLLLATRATTRPVRGRLLAMTGTYLDS